MAKASLGRSRYCKDKKKKGGWCVEWGVSVECVDNGMNEGLISIKR